MSWYCTPNSSARAKSFVRRLPLLLACAASLAGCGAEEAREEAIPESTRNVRVLSLAAESLDEYFEISGPVAPVRGVDLSAEEAGPIVALTVAKGERVQAGQILIEQERRTLAAEKEAAAAHYQAQAFNVDKVRQLHAAGRVSEVEMLNTEAQYEQAKAAAALADRRYARAGFEAPFAGVVTDRYVELGELVMPGTRVIRVIDPYILKLEAYLTAEQVGWLAVGDPAQVLLGDGQAPAAGEVSWIGFEADRLTGKFKVEVRIENPELAYRAGVIGRARLPKDRREGVITIPRDAVIPARSGDTAFVVENDRAVLRRITLGSGQGMMVQVLDGLSAGDDLVVRGHRELREGNLVSVTERTTAADGSLPGDPAEVTAAAAGTRIGDAASDGSGDGAEAGR